MEAKISIYLTCKTSDMLHDFVFTTKTTRTRLQVFSVTRLIIWQQSSFELKITAEYKY